MPTIHIHLNDSGEALELVADMLNRGFGVSVDIDEAQPRPKVAQRDPLARPFIDMRDQATDAEMAAEEAHIEALTGFPAKIADRPEDRAAVRAKTQARNAALVKVRNERYQSHMRDVDDARRLKCPTCRAEADQRCLKASGQVYDRGFAHSARIRKARGF